jgi:hypothetical protein
MFGLEILLHIIGSVERWAARMRGETVPDPLPTAAAAPVVPDLVPDKNDSTAASNPGSATAVLPNVLRGGPMPAQPARRTGWLVVAVGVAVLLAFAVYLAIDEADLDPDDPGAADVAFFVSPMLAMASAVVTGMLLLVVARFRMVSVDVSQAFRAMVVGFILGPITYLAFLIVIASPLDAAHSGVAVAMVSFIVPTISGIGWTLGTAVIRGRKNAASGSAVGGDQ